jgi:hypothetical protein
MFDLTPLPMGVLPNAKPLIDAQILSWASGEDLSVSPEDISKVPNLQIETVEMKQE